LPDVWLRPAVGLGTRLPHHARRGDGRGRPQAPASSAPQVDTSVCEAREDLATLLGAAVGSCRSGLSLSPTVTTPLTARGLM
jgi:hypothetical protein